MVCRDAAKAAGLLIPTPGPAPSSAASRPDAATENVRAYQPASGLIDDSAEAK